MALEFGSEFSTEGMPIKFPGSELGHFLATLAWSRRGRGPLPEGFEFLGLEDLLSHPATSSQQFFPQPPSPEYRELYEYLVNSPQYCMRKACYRNAALAALSHPDIQYVEGMSYHMFPVQHAWNLLPDGTIVDCTWCGVGSPVGSPGEEYIGFVVPKEVLRARVNSGKPPEVFDWPDIQQFLMDPPDWIFADEEEDMGTTGSIPMYRTIRQRLDEPQTIVRGLDYLLANCPTEELPANLERRLRQGFFPEFIHDVLTDNDTFEPSPRFMELALLLAMRLLIERTADRLIFNTEDYEVWLAEAWKRVAEDRPSLSDRPDRRITTDIDEGYPQPSGWPQIENLTDELTGQIMAGVHNPWGNLPAAGREVAWQLTFATGQLSRDADMGDIVENINNLSWAYGLAATKIAAFRTEMPLWEGATLEEVVRHTQEAQAKFLKRWYELFICATPMIRVKGQPIV